MLAGELVNAALERLAQPEIIPAQRQDLLALDGVEHPLGEFDFDPEQAAIDTLLAANSRSVDQAERIRLLLIAGANIGLDPGTSEAIDRLAQGVVVLAGGAAVRKPAGPRPSLRDPRTAGAETLRGQAPAHRTHSPTCASDSDASSHDAC